MTRTPGAEITRNLIYGNGGLGIDLAPFTTINCPSSSSGANNGILCPVLMASTSTRLVSGTTCSNCTVEVYIATAPNTGDSGYGQASAYLGTATASLSGAWSLAAPFASTVHAEPLGELRRRPRPRAGRAGCVGIRIGAWIAIGGPTLTVTGNRISLDRAAVTNTRCAAP